MNLFFPLIFVVFLVNICLSKIVVNETGEISFQEVYEKEVWECFNECKAIEGSYKVVVFVVESKQHSFKFVLKRFPPKESQLFQDEKAANSMIPESPYFPKYYGSFITQDTREGFLIMEWIDSIDLSDVIIEFDENTRISSLKSCLYNSMRFIAAELASAIQILHDAGIVHRDIKPENIIIDRNGHLKLYDFGYSIKLKSLQDRMKRILGTKTYLAPEIINHNYNYQVDWYSYGIVITNLIKDYVSENEFFFMKQDSILHDLRYRLDDEEYQLIDSCTVHNADFRVKSLEEMKEFAIFKNINWNEMKLRIAQPPGIFFSFFLFNL